MKKLIFLACVAVMLALPKTARANADVALAWDPPPATPITDLASLKYNLYFAINGGAMTNLLATTTNLTVTVTNLAPANYSVVCKAVNAWNVESPPSNVLTLPTATIPTGPVNFRATVIMGTFNFIVR